MSVGRDYARREREPQTFSELDCFLAFVAGATFAALVVLGFLCVSGGI